MRKSLRKRFRPSDGNMVDGVVSESDGYRGIESKVSSDTFYSLLSTFKGDKFDNTRLSFTVSAYHYSLMEMIRHGDIIRASESDLIRAIVCIGIITKCRLRGRCEGMIKAAIENKSYHRHNENMLRFEKSIRRVNLNDEATKKYLKLLVESYGNNRYGKEIWNRIHNGWDIPDIKFRERSVYILDSLKDRCRRMVSKNLSDKMYELKKDSNNKQLKVYFSKRFHMILYRYRREFLPDRLTSEILRGFFVAGLFSVSKWVIENRISKEEYDFSMIINGIDEYAATT